MTQSGRGFRALSLASLLVACSSHDQTLGETRRAPSPSAAPTPSLKPAPQPVPDPAPDPQPVGATCEDSSLHVRTGHCVAAGTCFGDTITLAGYECPGGQICCDYRVGCPSTGCGGRSAAGTPPVGAGGDAAGASG